MDLKKKKKAVQLAKSYGATVYACDFKPEARELALSLGAEQVFDHAELTAATADTAENPFTVDIAIDFVVDAQSFSLTSNAVKRVGGDLSNSGGVVVLVGISSAQLTITPIVYITWHINVKTSVYGTIDDLKAALDLLARGVIKPVVSTDSLDNINKVLDALKANEVTGRKIILPNSGVAN
ncbi:hypothetical protein L226DRAFT_527548 [Lentinus tigrinus ALCF2SS1-7]|uniref:Alcohol dehydrogenase-like C-terminal domain-containing protein n=1 Tax=Lentinus tigrinus ALCF2SS1-6 TaxID=1328759 RepID=A0A5C2SLJ3_9APHY|nr:hypothetical protein L227DRAFT_608172 [Lentinus tigrinus ALCF2SS1-6]RPD67959.1 hypothetical protein L226DRAFT_527548 [Lentinus tigrinus ALCF2SS1-7]